MKEVVIVSALRTPFGSFGGGLKSFSAAQLGSFVIKEIISQSGMDAREVDEVLMGCVLQANVGQAPARQAALLAGLPNTVPCTTVNKVCASGMKAVMQAAQAIKAGDIDVAIVGGMESMSNVPFYAANMRWGHKYGNASLIDGLAKDGLSDAYTNEAMGMAAELCAKECAISRDEQDAFAIESYKRSQAAWEAGKFSQEVIPISIPQRKGEPIIFQKDEDPYNVNFDKIPALSPAFKKDGTVTAANASTMNDGAAAMLIMSAEKAAELNLKPLAKIIGYADAAQAPEWFTTTPAIALPKAIKNAGLEIADIDLWELNEAFSVVGIENTKRLGVSADKVNVQGGAVSIGHPLGASGARIIVTLVHQLQNTNAKYGAAGICNGGGGASAMVIEKM